MKAKNRIFLILVFFTCCFVENTFATIPPKVTLGVDRLFNKEYAFLLTGKRIGLITNHTAINQNMQTTADFLKAHAQANHYQLVALFAPEHGIKGVGYAWEHIHDEKDPDGIPIYSLHGKTRRPTQEMLKNVEVLLYDIQDIGSRSYTYSATLFFAMEEAAKQNIPVVVLDRPNPMNGTTVDGPMMEEKWRSIVGYLNVPYCHGMTIGELAQFFNEEYHVGCQLHVIPMQGWKRTMSFEETGLAWVPTSPHIPEASTTFYYPTTGIVGELELVNIGVGYTLPFKAVGAPWIQAVDFAKHLNAQKFPGVHFLPFYYRPFYGKFAKELCQGVHIVITDSSVYKPVTTQYLIMGILKSLYPKHFREGIQNARKTQKELFHKVNGTEEVYHILTEKPYAVWPLKELHQKERKAFMTLRKKYLIPNYS